MDDPVTHRELGQFRDLMEVENELLKQENDRQNHRIAALEQSVLEISNLTASVRDLAASMKSMQKEQEKQGKRLELLEGLDGDKWRKVTGYIATTVIGIIIGFLFKQMGM